MPTMLDWPIRMNTLTGLVMSAGLPSGRGTGGSAAEKARCARAQPRRIRQGLVVVFSCFCLLNAYGLVVNKGFIASARLYPTMQYTLALP